MQISATTLNPAAPNPSPAQADAPAPAQAASAQAAQAAPQADAPAVTVTLSPEARAAQNALAAMPMADAVKTLTPGAQSGPLAQIKSLLLKLADGSGVPKAEQIQAYVDVQKQIFLDPDKAWWAQSTPDDRKAYAAIMDAGATSTEIRKAADDFNHWSLSQNMHSNVPRKNLAHMNAMSPLEQQMVFAGTVGMDMDSLDQWKAQIQVDIVNVDKMIALDEAEKKTGKSGKAAADAKVAEDGTAAPDEASPEAKALAALTAPDQGDGVAAAALKMLQKAAEVRAEAKDRSEKDQAEQDRKNIVAGANDTPMALLKPYEIGAKVDRAV